MKSRRLILLSAITLVIPWLSGPAGAADPAPLAPPPQDQGLPYTRSARQIALAKIKDHIAVFAGSRYAYVKGHKVRLDDVNWRTEAVLRDGMLLVPANFSGVSNRVMTLSSRTDSLAANEARVSPISIRPRGCW
jgi:hypothetical protein